MKNNRSGVKKGEKNIYDTKTHDLSARNSSRKDTLHPCGHQPDQYARIRQTGAILRSQSTGSDPADKGGHRYTDGTHRSLHPSGDVFEKYQEEAGR